MQQLIQYFNRFYNIVLKNIVDNPVIHSEWNYFVSMFQTQNLDKNRIELYLNILNSQHVKKGQSSISQISTKSVNHSDYQKDMVGSVERDVPAIDLKLNHQFSQKWRGNIDSFQKSAGQSLQLRKLTSQQQSNKTNRPPLNTQPKPPKVRKNSYTYAVPTSMNQNINSSYPKFPLTFEAKLPNVDKKTQKHTKLVQISNRIVQLFTKSSTLRA